MKKLLSIILAGAFMMSAAAPVFAEDTSETERVLKIVKTRVEDTAQYGEFRSNRNENDGKVSYDFSWEQEYEDGYKSLFVSATPSGIITSYYKNESDYEYDGNKIRRPKLKKLSSAEALEKAKELVKKLDPDIYPSLVIKQYNEQEDIFQNGFSFMIERQENGIPVYGNEGNVSLNSDATAIESFYITYDEGISFNGTDGVIGEEKAWESFAKDPGLEARYVTDYSDGQANGIQLVYSTDFGYDHYIDAKTGASKEAWYRRYFGNDRGMGAESEEKSMAAEMAADNEDVVLSDIEQSEIDKIDGLLSKEEAEEAVRSIKILDLDDREELIRIYLYRNDNKDNFFYNMHFLLKNDESFKSSYVCINARTGELLTFSSSDDTSAPLKTDGSKEQINAYIADAIDAISPAHFDEYKEEVYPDDETGTTYKRYVNGIVFFDDYIGISVSPESGKVTYYSYNYTDTEFPSTDGMISKEEALNAFKKYNNMSLAYYPAVSEGKEKTAKDAEFYALGYSIDNAYIDLDAKTGKPIEDYSAEEKTMEYTDISGHYAENAIKTLAKYGIGFDTKEFKPNDLITQGEFLALVESTFVFSSSIILNKDFEYDYYYKTAKRRGIIKNTSAENPDQPVSRSDAAVMMVRTMGLEEVALLSDIYRCPFDDVKNNIGYISILGGMKVFNGDENNHFNPDKMLSRADAIILIYNYLINN